MRRTTVPLDALSTIGFGGYRVSADSVRHREALRQALLSGCNLVDTASSYEHGRSEDLIGEVLAENRGAECFVVTKAGYVEETDRAHLPKAAQNELVTLASGVVHSIHPDFLRKKMEESRARLGRGTLDGFLLHNPEYYFQQERDTYDEELYRRIGRAFAYLEEEVSRGRLRYYGVSSNTLPLGALRLERLVREASKASTSHHFKLVQFPLNLLERGAAERRGGQPSLIDLARDAGILTFANRPLNAKLGDEVALLATRLVDAELVDTERFERRMEGAVELIGERLACYRLGAEESGVALGALNVWRAGCSRMESPEAADRLFESFLRPLLRSVYRGEIPNEVGSVFLDLQCRARARAVARMNARALAIRAELERAGTIREDDGRDLAAIACDGCLDMGVDHVLVGMRALEYVDRLRPLFRAKSHGSRSDRDRSMSGSTAARDLAV